MSCRKSCRAGQELPCPVRVGRKEMLLEVRGSLHPARVNEAHCQLDCTSLSRAGQTVTVVGSEFPPTNGRCLSIALNLLAAEVALLFEAVINDRMAGCDDSKPGVGLKSLGSTGPLDTSQDARPRNEHRVFISSFPQAKVVHSSGLRFVLSVWS